MSGPAWLLAVVALTQVPPPHPASEASQDLRAELRTLLESESDRLKALATQQEARGRADEAAETRTWVEPVPNPDGPTRFEPLPEVVPAPAAGGAGKPGPSDEVRTIRSSTARAAFEIAGRAHKIGRYAVADQCLRDVVEREPGHAEARRLLGYLPLEGGWATPFAAAQLEAGRVRHPTYGWVARDWVERLDRGELPAPPPRSGPTTWLPAEMADALRRDWKPPWEIFTEHFHIRTNVPMSEAIAFGRRLEDFHPLFFSLLADLLGPELPLARRFRDPGLTAEVAKTPHRVYYFAEKSEYVAAVSPLLGSEIAASLGVYLTPELAKKARTTPTSFFYRDPDGEIEAHATLYHEVSHQLLFESRRTRYNTRTSHYWAFEGLGTYFETVDPRPDGSILVGGQIGPRVDAARKRLVDDGERVPIERLVAMDKLRFDGQVGGGDVYLHYAEAMALTLFLMQADAARHRETFLDYVEAVFRGSAGRSLDDRLGVPYADLEAQLLDYLGRRPSRAGPD